MQQLSSFGSFAYTLKLNWSYVEILQKNSNLKLQMKSAWSCVMFIFVFVHDLWVNIPFMVPLQHEDSIIWRSSLRQKPAAARQEEPRGEV